MSLQEGGLGPWTGAGAPSAFRRCCQHGCLGESEGRAELSDTPSTTRENERLVSPAVPSFTGRSLWAERMQVLEGRRPGLYSPPLPPPGSSSIPAMASSPTITGGRNIWSGCWGRLGSAWPTCTWEWMCSPGAMSSGAGSIRTRWVVAFEAWEVVAVARVPAVFVDLSLPSAPQGKERQR